MTANPVSRTRPKWISTESFPFESRFFSTEEGCIHYVDEGDGAPVVFVHGNPSWSFEFRHLISALKTEYRCVALDHLGFGLSDRTDNKAAYHPREHAKRFSALMQHLDLDHITLVVADWGGPIALHFAGENPARVSKIVVTNSWCWPVDSDPHFVKFSSMMSSRVGQFLIKRFNFFVNQVMPRAVGNRRVLTKEVMKHYRNAQPDAAAREASAAFPGYIVGATEWIREIWARRDKFDQKPLLLLWGLKDIAFRRNELQTWQKSFSDVQVKEFLDCGHFLAEESPEAVVGEIKKFLASGDGND